MVATITHYYDETGGIQNSASNKQLESIPNNEGMDDNTAAGMTEGMPVAARPPKGRPPSKQPAQQSQAP